MKVVYLTFLLLQVFIFSNSQTTSLKTIKPALDTSVLDKWPSVENPVISNDGMFAMFTINNVPAYQKTLVIRSLRTDWKKEITGGRNASFTNRCDKAIFLNSNDSLGIIDLTNYKIRYIPAISSFKIGNGNQQWLAFQIKGNKGLTIENLNTGTQKTFDKVISYLFSPSGRVLLLQRDHSNATSDILQDVVWINLISQIEQIIWEGNEASNFVFGKSDSNLAFIKTDRPLSGDKHQTQNSIWCYKAGTQNATLLIDNSFKGIVQDNLVIERISGDGFSNNGNLLFLSLKEREDTSSERYGVKLDVWSYFDPKLQSQQLAEVNVANYLAVLNIQTLSFTLILPNKLCRTEVGRKTKSLALVTCSRGEFNEWSWNAESRQLYSLVDLETGKNVQLFKDIKNIFVARDISISPDENYVIGIDQDRRNVYIYDIKSGSTRNVSSSIKVPEGRMYSDEPQFQNSKSLTVAGWLPVDKAFLVYDQFDIWQIDPTGKSLPKNVTNGYGRKHNIVFRLARNSYSNEPVSDTLILVSVDQKTKQNGFYKKILNSNKEPELISKGNVLFYIPDEPLGRAIMKSKLNNVYLVERQTSFQSPNYCWTTDLKNFTPISEIYPENKFKWLKSELDSFTTLDGRTEMGILYTPEDFDSTKKYPLLINYYSIRSNELNKYHQPGSEGGFLDISWFVSHEYLVFIPDIHYKVGEPGESALNSIVGAAKWFSKQKWVDSKKIGIQGHSFGGYETNYVICHTHLFAAACSSSGVSNEISSYLSLWGTGNSRLPAYELGQHRLGKTLWENKELYVKNSPIFYVNNITTPLLTISNKLDGNVPFPQGIELFLALRRLGKKAWMLQYDGQSHGVTGNARIDYIMRMTQFFNYYLKGEPAPEWMVKGIPANRKGIDSGLSLEPKGSRPGPSLLEKSQEDGFRVLGAIKD